MLVKNWMNKNVASVGPKDSIIEATEKLKESQACLLPVMDGRKLVGVVTDRDIKHASASDANSLSVHELLYILARLDVKQIMSSPAITVPMDFTLDETADLLIQKKITGAPVLDKSGAVVGVIGKDDIFRAFTELTGLSRRGIHFAVTIRNKPGSIKEVADIIRKYGGRLASIISANELSPEKERTVYFRVIALDRRELDRMMDEVRGLGHVHYIVDLRDNKREIYD